MTRRSDTAVVVFSVSSRLTDGRSLGSKPVTTCRGGGCDWYPSPPSVTPLSVLGRYRPARHCHDGAPRVWNYSTTEVPTEFGTTRLTRTPRQKGRSTGRGVICGPRPLTAPKTGHRDGVQKSKRRETKRRTFVHVTRKPVSRETGLERGLPDHTETVRRPNPRVTGRDP